MNIESTISEQDNVAIISGRPSTVEISELSNADFQHMSSLYWDWLQLFEQDKTTKIIQHPDYIFSELVNTVDDADRPLYQLKASDGEGDVTLAVLVPKDWTATGMGGMLQVAKCRGYRLAGNCFYGSQNEFLQTELLKSIGQLLRTHRASFLMVEDLGVETRLWRLIESNRDNGLQRFLPKPVQKKHRIRFPEDPAEYWSQFSKNARKKFRSALKKVGDVELVRVTKASEVGEFLQQAHQISLNSWQSHRLGIRIKNNEAELRQLIFLAEQGALRSYLLLKDGQPVAFELDHQFNGYVHSEEAGYDQRFAKYSIGKVLLYKVIEDLFTEDRPEWFDFGEGDAPYKNQFSNHVSMSGNVWLMPAGMRTRAMMSWLRTNQVMGLAARNILEYGGLKTKVRQFVHSSGVGKFLAD